MLKLRNILFLLALCVSSGLSGGFSEIKLRLTPIAEKFNNPVDLTYAGDNSGRLFVAEQAGLIRVADVKFHR